MELWIKTEEAKQKFSGNHFDNILRLSNVLPKSLSPQAKGGAINCNIQGICELAHNLSHDLKLRILES